MSRHLIAAALLGASLAVPAHAQDAMQVLPNGSRPSGRGPAGNFSGSVWVDPQFEAPGETPLSVGHVTFEPGARSAWHTHPAGQLLIVTSGVGWVQEWNGRKREIRPGDVVWTPPGVKHWHGATPTSSLGHYAIQNSLEGRSVDWLEAVSDEQYGR